jgi:hypothetical protein
VRQSAFAPIAVTRHAAILRLAMFESWSSGIMRIAVVLVLTSIVAIPSTALPAAADTGPLVEQVFREFGLFGTWAINCQGPATPANPRVTINMPTAGVVIEDHDLGADYALNRYSVLAAQRITAERLAVDVIFQPGGAGEERQKLEFLVHGGTRRTMFNQSEGGPVRVKGGIALAHGSKTPLLRKCE